MLLQDRKLWAVDDCECGLLTGGSRSVAEKVGSCQHLQVYAIQAEMGEKPCCNEC